MKRLLIGLAAALALTTSAMAADAPKAPSWRDFQGVENSSYVEPSGVRVLQLSIVIKASPQQVFEAMTTAEGFKSWATPVAWVDPGLGGIMETSYNPAAAKGDPQNIKNRIEAYAPGRMIAIRNIQAPTGLKGHEVFNQIVSVFVFDDIGGGQTRVTFTGLGYKPGADFDALYAHFEWGNAYSLAALKKRFEVGPIDWAALAEKQKAAKAVKQVQGEND